MLTTADDGEKLRETFTCNRVNPALGIAHELSGGVTIFGNVSENSRAPTAITGPQTDRLHTQHCRRRAGCR